MTSVTPVGWTKPANPVPPNKETRPRRLAPRTGHEFLTDEEAMPRIEPDRKGKTIHNQWTAKFVPRATKSTFET